MDDSSAIAASAPVAQFSAPCNAFGRIVTADYTAQGEDCSKIISKSWDAINSVGASGDKKKTRSVVHNVFFSFPFSS